ncbi:hypothetical protein ACQ5ES_05860 [Pseudidiomarina sp. E22-M8]|uniref:hypothetical protein n=1 Tax=Pseudidiomarina sp. E22-M8 TaxID=3424768 RepID=UPI00403CEE78
MRTVTLISSLKVLALTSLLSVSATQAAEESIVIKGELTFSSLPMLGEYQGVLAEPLHFTATVVEDAALAASEVVLGYSQEYVNATRELQMQISTAAGDILYDELITVDELANAAFIEAYSLFVYGNAAQATNYDSGSALWAIISGGEQRFVDREINLGADLLSRGVGAGVPAGVENLFADTSSYPVLVTGNYVYSFLYYDNSINNLSGDGYQGIVQGYATSISYGDTDADGDGIDDATDSCPASDTSATVVFNGVDSEVVNFVGADGCTLADTLARCEQQSSCSMKLIQNLRKTGDLSIPEANALRQASQIGYHSNRPR